MHQSVIRLDASTVSRPTDISQSRHYLFTDPSHIPDQVSRIWNVVMRAYMVCLLIFCKPSTALSIPAPAFPRRSTGASRALPEHERSLIAHCKPWDGNGRRKRVGSKW